MAALRTSTERLRTLLADAATTTELVAAEGALTQRQAELESLQAQRTALAGQVSLATLTLDFGLRSGAPAAGPGGFTGGLAAGWGALVAAASAGLVVAGVLLPWVVAAGAVAAVVAGAVGLGRRAARGVRAAAGRRRGGSPAA